MNRWGLWSAYVEEHEKHRVKHHELNVQFDRSGEAIDGFSEVDGVGIEIDFFDFCVGTRHEVLAPETNREHSIGDQVAALNVGFMERLQSNWELMAKDKHISELSTKLESATGISARIGQPIS